MKHVAAALTLVIASWWTGIAQEKSLFGQDAMRDACWSCCSRRERP
jgi:hypothetical protein